MKKMFILQFPYKKKCLSYNFLIWKNVYSTISIYEKTLILEFFKQFSESMKL